MDEKRMLKIEIALNEKIKILKENGKSNDYISGYIEAYIDGFSDGAVHGGIEVQKAVKKDLGTFLHY